jgi:hypothetical protein
VSRELFAAQAPDTEDEWKEEAVRRWGPYVENPKAAVTDWKTYAAKNRYLAKCPAMRTARDELEFLHGLQLRRDADGSPAAAEPARPVAGIVR